MKFNIKCRYFTSMLSDKRVLFEFGDLTSDQCLHSSGSLKIEIDLFKF